MLTVIARKFKLEFADGTVFIPDAEEMAMFRGRIEENSFDNDSMGFNGAQQLVQALNVFNAESLQGQEMITVDTVSGWNKTVDLTCFAGDNLLKKAG